jgi:hypothetical protein
MRDGASYGQADHRCRPVLMAGVEAGAPLQDVESEPEKTLKVIVLLAVAGRGMRQLLAGALLARSPSAIFLFETRCWRRSRALGLACR